jgi:hypothetical protein
VLTCFGPICAETLVATTRLSIRYHRVYAEARGSRIVNRQSTCYESHVRLIVMVATCVSECNQNCVCNSLLTPSRRPYPLPNPYCTIDPVTPEAKHIPEHQCTSLLTHINRSRSPCQCTPIPYSGNIFPTSSSVTMISVTGSLLVSRSLSKW